jgi:nucleoid DNA-binding protein
MAKLTQTEIVNSLAEKTGMKKTEVKGFFDALANLAQDEVKANLVVVSLCGTSEI